MSEQQPKKLLTEKSIASFQEFVASASPVNSSELESGVEIYFSIEENKIQGVEDIFVGNPFDAMYLYENPKPDDLSGLQRGFSKKKKAVAAVQKKAESVSLPPPYEFKTFDVNLGKSKRPVTTGIRFGFIQTGVKLDGQTKAKNELFVEDMPQDNTRTHYSPTAKSHNTIAYMKRFHLENMVSNWQLIGGIRADDQGTFQICGIKKASPNYN